MRAQQRLQENARMPAAFLRKRNDRGEAQEAASWCLFSRPNRSSEAQGLQQPCWTQSENHVDACRYPQLLDFTAGFHRFGGIRIKDHPSLPHRSISVLAFSNIGGLAACLSSGRQPIADSPVLYGSRIDVVLPILGNNLDVLNVPKAVL